VFGAGFGRIGLSQIIKNRKAPNGYAIKPILLVCSETSNHFTLTPELQQEYEEYARIIFGGFGK
jgi:hypothetical protein